MKRECGQSLLEVAVAVPLLLLILVGIVDLGRLYMHTISLSNGAREGAMLAAALEAPDDAAVTQRVCDATGFAELGEPCDRLTLLEASVGGADAPARVVVAYDVDLLYGRLLGPFVGTVRIRTSATFPGLAP